VVILGGMNTKQAIVAIIESIGGMIAVFKSFSTDISRRGNPSEVKTEKFLALTSWVTELNGLGVEFTGSTDWLHPEHLDLNNFTVLMEDM